MSSLLQPAPSAENPLHRLDARVKFMVALGFIVTTSLLPSGAWPAYILLLTMLYIFAQIGAVNILVLIRRAWPALIFIIAALPLIFTIPGQPIFVVSRGGIHLVATMPGLTRFASIAIKAWLSVQAAVLLGLTTPFPELLAAMRGLYIPRFLVALLGLMGRYLFVFSETARQLLAARKARSSISIQSGLRPGGSLFWRARVTGGMVGNLLIRSLEQGDRIYAAMLSRGYDGEARSLAPARISLNSLLVMAGIGLIYAVVLLLGLAVAG